MQNFSAIYAETMQDFETMIVPASMGDAAKGQVNVRAGYKIYSLGHTTVGFIAKNPGQVQHLGVAVDCLLDNRDGSWDDYLTDVPVGDGSLREVRLAHTPHGPAGSPPYTGWVQPTLAMTQQPGPLTLKESPGPGPDPGPGPAPPADTSEVIAKLDQVLAALDQMRNQQAADTARVIANDDANTEKIQSQIHGVVEDAEASGKKILAIWMAANRPGTVIPPLGEGDLGEMSLNDVVSGLLTKLKGA
jgi:hypothetical protein